MCPLYDNIDFLEEELLYIKKGKKEIYIDMNEISGIEVTKYHNTEEEE